VNACSHSRAQGTSEPLATSKRLQSPGRVGPRSEFSRGSRRPRGHPFFRARTRLKVTKVQSSRRGCNYLYTTGSPGLDPHPNACRCQELVLLYRSPNQKKKMIQFAYQMASKEIAFWRCIHLLGIHDCSQRSLCEPASLGTERKRRLEPKFVGEGISMKVFLTCWHSEAAPSGH